eukprot:gene20144-24113_t
MDNLGIVVYDSGPGGSGPQKYETLEEERVSDDDLCGFGLASSLFRDEAPPSLGSVGDLYVGSAKDLIGPAKDLIKMEFGAKDFLKPRSITLDSRLRGESPALRNLSAGDWDSVLQEMSLESPTYMRGGNLARPGSGNIFGAGSPRTRPGMLAEDKERDSESMGIFSLDMDEGHRGRSESQDSLAAALSGFGS